MSKSYGNTIPLFCSEKKLLKLIRKIKTNSLEPGEPKDPDTCTLFQIYSAFVANETLIAEKRKQYEEGAGWGDLKNQLFEVVNAQLKEPREKYEALIADPAYIEEVLQKGAEKARAEAKPFLAQIRHSVGLRPLA